MENPREVEEVEVKGKEIWGLERELRGQGQGRSGQGESEDGTWEGWGFPSWRREPARFYSLAGPRVRIWGKASPLPQFL